MSDAAFDAIRKAMGGTMRLSFDKLVQLGYAPDDAKAVLLRMMRGIAGQLDG